MTVFRCPLPIDLLDQVTSGGASPPLVEHVRDCPSCRRAIRLIATTVEKDLAWRFKIDPGAPRAWSATSVRQPQFGDIWMTQPSLLTDNRSTSDQDSPISHLDLSDPASSTISTMVLVITRKADVNVEVLPLIGSIEESLPTDVVLSSSDSSLGVPLRAMFSCQREVDRSALSHGIGHLRDSGIGRIEAATQGKFDLLWTGAPLEGPDDPRLATSSAVDRILDHVLSSPMAEESQAGRSDPVLRDDADEAGTAIVIRMRYGPRQRHGLERAPLAAADEDEEHNWRAEHQGWELAGVLECDPRSDELAFIVTDVKGQPQTMRLIGRLRGTGKMLKSDAFIASPNAHIMLAIGRAISPTEVESLELRIDTP